jgi:hypothetical protein
MPEELGKCRRIRANADNGDTKEPAGACYHKGTYLGDGI